MDDTDQPPKRGLWPLSPPVHDHGLLQLQRFVTGSPSISLKVDTKLGVWFVFFWGAVHEISTDSPRVRVGAEAGFPWPLGYSAQAGTALVPSAPAGVLRLCPTQPALPCSGTCSQQVRS